jgi:protein O-GlcNAc transferase
VNAGDHWRRLLAEGYRRQQAGNPGEAVAPLRGAAAVAPDRPEVWQLLGLCAAARAGNDTASMMGRAWRASPTDHGLRANYALALRRAALCALQDDRKADAMSAIREALALRPDDPENWATRCDAERAGGDPAAAKPAGERAVALNPAGADGLNRLADALALSGEWTPAGRLYRRVLRLDPFNEQAMSNLSALSGHAGEASPSLTASKRAVALRPDAAGLYGNLGGAWITACLPAAAAAAYGRAATIEPKRSRWLSNRLMSLQYSGISPLSLAAEHRRFDAMYGRSWAGAWRAPSNSPDPDRPLRIGYVSPDFRQHVVMRFFQPLLTAHDRAAVTVVCYSDVVNPDRVTEQAAAAADLWRDTEKWSDEKLANAIRTDGVDILVDLAGHSAGRRMGVFARRPAPLSVTWLGYPDTTGLSSIDYRITDAVADPDGDADALASETLLRLPSGFLCYAPPQNAPLPTLRRNDEGPVFGSFNNLAKVGTETVALWSAVMKAVPAARLMIKARSLADAGVAARFRAAFADIGVAGDRLILSGWEARAADHLAAYRHVDLALDPFPYNGTTTTCEALWMGVPVATLRGERHAARVGAGILRQVGLDELVAESPAQFVHIVSSLSRDAGRLSMLRTGLRDRMAASSLTDAAGFARRMENAYRRIWRRWCASARGSSQEGFLGL